MMKKRIIATTLIAALAFPMPVFAAGAHANNHQTKPAVVSQVKVNTMQTPQFAKIVLLKDKIRGDRYRLTFKTPGKAKAGRAAQMRAVPYDAISTASVGGGGGGSVAPNIPPLPEPTPEMKAMYAYTSSLKTYMNEVQDSSITVNGKAVREAAGLHLEDTNSFLVTADEHDLSRNYVEFSKDVFQKLPAKVVIKVDGYKDLKINVKKIKAEQAPVMPEPKPEVTPDPQPEPEVPQEPVAPEFTLVTPDFGGVTLVKDMFKGNYYRLDFKTPAKDVPVDAIATASVGGGNGGSSSGGGSVPPEIEPLPEPTPEMKAMYAYVSNLKTYLNEAKDSSITVNGKEVTEATGLHLEETNSFFVTCDEHDITNNYVSFSLDCFKDQPATVVIKVAGFEDLTFTVENLEVPEVAPEVKPDTSEAVVTTPVAESLEYKSSYNSGYTLKLVNPAEVSDENNVYNFVSKLTSVTVNDKAYQKKSGFGRLKNRQYDTTAGLGEITFNAQSFGKGSGIHTVVLKAEGFDPLTVTVSNGKLVK